MKMTRRDFLRLSSAAAAACGVTLLPAQKADAASEIQTLLEEAYLYAFPLVLVDATKTVSTNAKTPSANRAPVNQFIHARKLLDASRGKPEEAAVSMMVLRALMKARYDGENLGHFGLGAKYYCHFTSPIRRYPDVLVHRALGALIDGRIDLQDDAPRTTAQVVQNARTVIVPAQNGFDGQMFEVGVAFVGEPPEDQPHEQVAVPHALGIQAAVGERGVVVPFAAALARRERSFVKSVRRSPAGVGGGEESPVCQCFHRR